MKPETPGIDQGKTVSPHAQEVEYALILSRMISRVKDDPSQMRLIIYEFARAKLKVDMAWADEGEHRRLSSALETAIQGVEEFSARRDGKESVAPPAPSRQIAPTASAVEPEIAASTVAVFEPSAAPKATPLRESYPGSNSYRAVDTQTRILLSPLARLSVVLLLFGSIVGLALYKERMPPLRAGTSSPAPQASAAETGPPKAAPAASEAKTAVSAVALPFPLPNDYGVYAVSGTALSELHPLSEQVPDKRVAMSTPLSEPSRTTIPDGKAKFIVFRRDLVGSAPDRLDVRVVARVVRALRFDAKGKPSFSPVSDAWNIRNLSFEFRVRPIAGNAEMLLIQAENPDFTLPPGRYVLALRSQGYDFTVAGKITDPWQCLERTDAANGTFYSDCQKQ